MTAGYQGMIGAGEDGTAISQVPYTLETGTIDQVFKLGLG